MQLVQVSVEATIEHPFFVIGQGWSSHSPDRSKTVYDLGCHKLAVGDICISLTQRHPKPDGASLRSVFEGEVSSIVASKNNAHLSTPSKVEEEKVKAEAEIDVDKVDSGESL